MAKYDLNLRPVHYASVSGGKDSLYMLNIILQNPDKYPLDMVVHFQLEIDWGWSNRVVDFMEKRCKAAGIKFLRLKPSKSYWEMYEKWGFPTRIKRWCNNHYKLLPQQELDKWIVSQNCRPIAYIGLCADETKRFKYEIGGGNWKNQDICYPLAEEGIEEKEILEWAYNIPIFEGWYKHFKRQGCMLCPMISQKELAYMCKYENESYLLYLKCCKEYEEKNDKREPEVKHYGYSGMYTAEQLDRNVKKKWIPILELEESQMTIFDFEGDKNDRNENFEG